MLNTLIFFTIKLRNSGQKMKSKLFWMTSMFFLYKFRNKFNLPLKLDFGNLQKGNIAYCETAAIPENKSDFKLPYLGCSIRNTDYGVGMSVIMVKSDSPAEKAGIKIKDVILEIDGKPINTIHDYNGAVGYEPGKKKIIVLRKQGDDEKRIEVIAEFVK